MQHMYFLKTELTIFFFALTQKRNKKFKAKLMLRSFAGPTHMEILKVPCVITSLERKFADSASCFAKLKEALCSALHFPGQIYFKRTAEQGAEKVFNSGKKPG